MNDYVSKPVSPQALCQVLEKWLSQRTGLRRTGNGDREAHPQKIEDKKMWDRTAMIERVMGDDDLAKLIVQTFLSDAPNQIKSLNESMEKENIEEVRRQAHTIKGMAANMSAEALREVAFEIEMAAKDGNLATVRESMKKMKQEFERLRKAMSTFPN